MHANFHDLSRCPPLHEERDLIRPRRVYTLLGATLANLRNEVDLFTEVSRWTKRGDLLVIDFQLARAPASDPAQVRASEPPLLYGPSPTHHQWLTGPGRVYFGDETNGPAVLTAAAPRAVSSPAWLPRAYFTAFCLWLSMPDVILRNSPGGHLDFVLKSAEMGFATISLK